MLASICRRRLLRLRQIPISHGYSSAALAGAALSEPCPATVPDQISCGLTPAAAAPHKLRILSTQRADAVRALFRSYGFTDADITEMVRRRARIFTLDPDRILRPKLDFFASIGLRPRRLATAPTLLTRSLDNHIVPCIQFLRGILGTDGDVCSAISRFPRAMDLHLEKTMRPAVAALRRLGLPEESISKLLTVKLGVLMISPDRLSEIIEDLKALGLPVTGTSFVYGMCTLCGLGRETLLRKVALYQSFGVSKGELLRAFKKQPLMLVYSDESIKKKLRFLLDELKLELSEVTRQPVIIGYSPGKNLKRKCAVLSVLMREGKIEPNIKLLSALRASDKIFSKRFVSRYADDAPDVVKAYEGKIIFEGFRDQGVLVPLRS